MSREILFRGKRMGDNEWAYGFYVFVPKGRFSEPEHLIQTIADDGRVGLLVNVDPTTVGQFTGLCDKNGKKVFDGDVVHCYGSDTTGNSYDWKAIVEFGNPNAEYNWGFQLKPLTEFRHNTDILLWVEMQDYADIYCEVIGTIHDKEG